MFAEYWWVVKIAHTFKKKKKPSHLRKTFILDVKAMYFRVEYFKNSLGLRWYHATRPLGDWLIWIICSRCPIFLFSQNRTNLPVLFEMSRAVSHSSLSFLGFFTNRLLELCQTLFFPWQFSWAFNIFSDRQKIIQGQFFPPWRGSEGEIHPLDL